MIRPMNMALMSVIVMAGMVFTQGPLAPGKEDDGDDRGAPPVAAPDWSVAVPGWKPVAVDDSGASGAALLVAQVGPQVGFRVEYSMDIKQLNLPRDVKDVSGADGFATKTTIPTADPARPWAIMTLKQGEPPAVVVDGDTVRVGGQTLTFDGEKIVLGR